MSLLQLRNVNKYYKVNNKDTFHALRKINVSFHRGELVSIIGESGSGKSTMMNLIGGLDSSFDGAILIDGENIGNFNDKQLDAYRKNKIGFVFQSCNLIPHLSILDNVTIALTLSNVSKEERTEKAKKALKEVGLEKHIDKRPNQLSGGQRQRVAIARALINDPEIILADEPTGALDSETTVQVLNIIKDIAKKGRLVIMVTHSEKVAANSSRVVKIADGLIIEDTGATVADEIAVSNMAATKSSQNLSFFSAVKLAGNNMRQKFKRNILVSFGVSIGIVSIIMMLALGSGLKGYFSGLVNGFINPLVVEVSMPIKGDPTDPTAMMNAMMGATDPFEKSDIDKLSKIQGVTKVEEGFSLMSMMGTNTVSLGDKTSEAMMLKSMSSSITDKNLEKGTLPKDGEILVNSVIAKELGVNVIGQTVDLSVFDNGSIAKGKYIISGIYKPLVDDEMANLSGMLYMHYDDLSVAFKDHNMKLNTNSVFLSSDTESESAKVREEVKKLGYGGSAEEMAGGQMLSMFDVMTVVLAAISMVSLLVSSIMILVVLHISVVERTKEIGLLRAIGARSKDIKRIFVSEAFLIGISSGIIGVITAALISIGANVASTSAMNMKVMNLTPGYALLGIALSTGVSMIAGLVPAKKASKLDPVDSLRTE